jgi:protein-S-isoprenylcysteine O-methyltransferase Ste14
MVMSQVGFWLRRYRRLLPFPLAAIVFLVLQPGSSGGSAELLTTIAGAAFCFLGQGLRLWAWGSNGTVGSHGVRDRGPYALMRHPLYSGNFIILLGMVVVFDNVWAYPVLLLPFAYLYRVIAVMDEQQMIQYSGPDYLGYYNRALTRFFPAWRNLPAALSTTAPFSWALAWRKEYGSCCAWLAGVVGLLMYKEALEQGYLIGNLVVLLLGGCAMIGIAVTIRTKRINDRRRRVTP